MFDISDILDFIQPVSLDELADYIVGDKVLSNNNEFSLVMLGIKDNPFYNFVEEEVFELYRKYENKELDRIQMSWHLVLLDTVIDIDNLSNSPLDTAKKEFNKEIKKSYLDEPIPEERINIIKNIFEKSYYERKGIC